MDPAELESLIEAELRQLPAPRAPQTLLPRVIAGVDAFESRPRHAQGWLTWPRTWQFASAAAFTLVLLGASWLGREVLSGPGSAAASTANQTLQEASSVLRQIETTANAVVVVWRALVRPVVAYAFVFVAAMFSFCVVLGIAINRFVFGKAFQP